MSHELNPDIDLYKSLFKGREDVFAIRWEKNDKSGYMPAYDFNWTEYAAHKAKGGTLKDFKNKQYSRLTDDRIRNHLSGKEVIGIYPLLPDNTSWFIVADFDEDIAGNKSWSEECKIFIKHCEELNILTYLERSRSGKGGHVWIFFQENYPAQKSRKIMLHILEKSGIISPLNKNSNYDRLFPNQDFHSGIGLGNLIALPLQQNSLIKGNSCFINPDTLVAFPDQGEFLRTIKMIQTAELDVIFESVTNTIIPASHSFRSNFQSGDPIQITLNTRILIHRQQLTVELITFLRENLNFINSDYIIKKKLGRNTFGTERYFMMMEEKDSCVIIPNGFAGKLIRFIRDQKLNYELIDERKKLTEVEFTFNGEIYDHQLPAIEAAWKKDMGIFVAPPGSGKTIIGLAIIAQKKQPALIIVHRKQLFEQWIERIQSFLGIAEAFIGKVSSGQKKIGNHITVAMIQSLATVNTDDELFSSFGTIIVDECHHVPAKTFREVINNFNSFYQYGLTATPIRKNNDEKLIFIHLGDVIHQVTSPNEKDTSKKIAITIRETDLIVPFDVKTDLSETLSNVLIHDSSRNRMIVEDVVSEVTAGRKVLILTERKAHIDTLYQYLKSRFEIIRLSGDDAESLRKTKFKQIAEGHFQILISTGQFLGEGSDIEKLDCLVLAYPFSFEGKLIQYIGRVQRGEITPVIYDYRDRFVDYLEKMFLQRNRYYKKLIKAKEIKKFDEITLSFNEDKVLVAPFDLTLSIYNLDLPLEIDKFREGVIWNLRVLDFNEESAELITEILDYRAEDVVPNEVQTSLSFITIDKIKFRSIDTSKFLQSVHLKPVYLPEKQEPVPVKKEVFQPPIVERKRIKKILRKKLKIPFDKIDFMNALVSFPVFIDELGKELTFEIENADIRPEFGAIKSYFIKILKKKEITADIEIHYADDKILSSSATSEDIARINRSLIDSMRFEFVKRDFLSFKGNKDTALETFNTLTETNKAVKPFFNSEEEFIEHFLNIENAKHYFQLRYLASQHQSSVLKIRFILNPFSFIFLLAGNNKYHVIWETLNSEEATYIWHFDKSMEALRKGLSEIEEILKKIKATSKLDYLRNDHPNFSRIIHEYGDARKGFVSWKGVLEQRLG